MDVGLTIIKSDDLLQFKQALIEEIKGILGMNNTAGVKTYLKSKEVRGILKCSNSTLQSYRESGKLPFTKIGRTYFYTKDSIDQLMA